MILKEIARFQAWKASEAGVTAVEYGLIAAGIAVATSAVVFAFGDALAGMFSDAGEKIAERPE